MTHLDEHGNVCPHHASAVADELLALATVASIASSSSTHTTSGGLLMIPTNDANRGDR